MSVERAAAKYAAAREELEREVRAAVAAGESLRTVAKRAGWSHEQVRRVLTNETKGVRDG